MSLNSIMNIATSGLQTAQAQLRVTSDNIANVNTVGYVRKIADQSASVTKGYGDGVDITRMRLATDRFLQAASFSANADAARHGVRSELFNQIQNQFGDPSSNTNFFAQIDKLFASYANLAESPTSSAARQDTIYKTQAMFDDAANIARQIQATRQEADSRIQSVVETINPLLEQIDKLNKTIAAGSVTNQDVTGAQNAQQSLINELSKYMDVKIEQRSNGGVTLRTGTGMTLVGEGHATLSYQAAGTVAATTAGASLPEVTPSASSPSCSARARVTSIHSCHCRRGSPSRPWEGSPHSSKPARTTLSSAIRLIRPCVAFTSAWRASPAVSARPVIRATEAAASCWTASASAFLFSKWKWSAPLLTPARRLIAESEARANPSEANTSAAASTSARRVRAALSCLTIMCLLAERPRATTLATAPPTVRLSTGAGCRACGRAGRRVWCGAWPGSR